jgi:putative membrane-bound dehydrogenase-like protein
MQVSQAIPGCLLALWTSFFFDCLLPHPVFAEEPLPQVERLKTSPVLRHLKPNPLPSPPRTPAEQTVAQMYLPEGFRAELVVAEPDLHQPVAFAWDERGRIWVVEAYSYPTKRPAGQGLDKVVIFEDREGDGKFETRKVFAEGLNLVSGLEVGYGGVWVGAAPELLFIPDRDRDDTPDEAPQALLDGFGYQDTHECLNSFLWGPDGWLYGNQGVFNTAHIGKPGAPDSERVELRAGVWRYHPVRHQFEVFAHGGSNQWGLDYDEHGQLFMSHCRSYFGRGGITHVIQGGHYWNQANANYAPFIVAHPPSDFPGFLNYLLASARHDHGAGGAGEPGTDAIFGGHSHVGTMIYLGDNWPDEFRGHLFTHNLGGHQINHDITQREGSGFKIVHAERDVFFCTDPKYVAVDLQYGPDGAVYVIDWYDRQHCHNPNTEIWDRGNGRIYRMHWQATYRPRKVNLAELSDAELVGLHGHKNEWFARTARRLLHERALARRLDSKAAGPLATMALTHKEPGQRLRALWTLHLIEESWADVAQKVLADSDEFVRAWAIRLLTDGQKFSRALLARLAKLAQSDPSPVVRLALASAVPRVPEDTAWELIEALAQHAEDRVDRNLPLLLWYALAQRMPKQLERAFSLAQRTELPQIADFTHWYAATLEGDGLNRAITALAKCEGDLLRRRLAGLWLAMEPRANVPMPAAWKQVAPRLYANADARVRQTAERLAAVFGDDSMFPRLRDTLASPSADTPTRQHAFAVLSRAQDRASMPVFLRLLDDAAFRSPTINLLGRFDAPEVAEALLSRFSQLSPQDRSAALNALTSRASFALPLLDAVAAGRLKREDLTSFHVRQLTALKHADVDTRVAATWGKLNQTPAEKQSQIARLEKVFNEAPLWAYDGGAGKQHFQKLCATCHVIRGEGTRVGPELTGAGKNGIRYFLENLIDPNAVIGADFQMTTLELKKGDVLSGLVVSETASALTVRTTTDQVVIPKADVAERSMSELSLMPEALLDSLSDREQIELLKFLTQN